MTTGIAMPRMSSIEAPAIPATPLEHIRWTVTDCWTITRRALLHWARQPAEVVFGLAFPIVMVVMFAYLFGGQMRAPEGGGYREFLMPGMFAMTMLFGVSQTVVTVAADAEKGVTDRFRSMPMSPVAVVAGRCIADTIYASITLAVMVISGLAVGWRASDGPGGAAAALGLLLLLRFALVWVGIYLGLMMKGQGGIVLVQTLEFPLGFMSNAFVQPGTMPGWLGAISEWNPMSSTVAAARELFGNPGAGGGSWVADHPTAMAIIWPLVIVAVFLPLAVRRYRGLSR